MSERDVMPFHTMEGQQEELAKVREWATSGDDESAHLAEKLLWHYTLVAIGAEILTGKDAALAARTALETLDLDFNRWFA